MPYFMIERRTKSPSVKVNVLVVHLNIAEVALGTVFEIEIL